MAESIDKELKSTHGQMESTPKKIKPTWSTGQTITTNFLYFSNNYILTPMASSIPPTVQSSSPTNVKLI